jgi:hypothetical protein
MARPTSRQLNVYSKYNMHSICPTLTHGLGLTHESIHEVAIDFFRIESWIRIEIEKHVRRPRLIMGAEAMLRKLMPRKGRQIILHERLAVYWQARWLVEALLKICSSVHGCRYRRD